MLTATAKATTVHSHTFTPEEVVSNIFVPEATANQAPEIDDSPLITLDDITGEALHGLGQVINDINRANGWKTLRPGEWGDTLSAESLDYLTEESQDYLIGEIGRLRAEVFAYKVPAVLMLIVTEVAEAMEAFRKGDKDNFIEELADTFIRILDCTHGLGMDLSSAVFAKLAKNRTRGYRHGGKRV